MKEMVHFIQQGYEAWPIWAASDHPIVQLAAEELRTYLHRITDRDVPIIRDPTQTASPYFELVHEHGHSDGFVRQVSDSCIRIIGRSPRGVLCAVYDLLEELGCRWYGPGSLGERFPRSLGAALPVGIRDEEPRLAGRGLILGRPEYLDQVEEWIDWAARNRLNTVFFRPFLGAGRNKHVARIRKKIRSALEEMEKRGMRAELGGQLLTELLPRSLLWRHRRAFRFDGRRRTSDHNLCASDSEGLEILRQRAARFFQSYRGIDVFHIWPSDLEQGGWCQCASCRQLTPSDQALQVINVLAEALEEVDPSAQIAFPAYRETRSAPVTVRPRTNVLLCYAPHGRCYAHSLDDAQCALNEHRYFTMLRDQLHWFSESATPHACEFYLDATLFDSMWPTLANILSADLEAYAQAGCNHVLAMLNGSRPLMRLPATAYLFAKLAWDPTDDTRALLWDYAAGYFGGPEEPLMEYLAEREMAFALMADLSPEDHAQDVASEERFRTKLGRKHSDCLDAPVEALRAKLAALQQARRHLEHAGVLLEAAARPGAGTKPRGRVTRIELLDQEKREFDLLVRIFEWLYRRQQACSLAAEKAPRRDLRAATRQGQKELARIVVWGKRELGKNKTWRSAFLDLCARWRIDLWTLDYRLARTPLTRVYWRWRIKRELRRLA